MIRKVLPIAKISVKTNITAMVTYIITMKIPQINLKLKLPFGSIKLPQKAEKIA